MFRKLHIIAIMSLPRNLNLNIRGFLKKSQTGDDVICRHCGTNITDSFSCSNYDQKNQFNTEIYIPKHVGNLQLVLVLKDVLVLCNKTDS